MKYRSYLSGVICSLMVIPFFSFASGKNWNGLQSSVPANAQVLNIGQHGDDILVSFTIPGYFTTEVHTPAGQAFSISVGKSSKILDAGSPDLCKLTASVAIPDRGSMDITVLSAHFTDIPGINIAPSKGNLYRNQDPSQVPFAYGPAYSSNSFYPGNLVSLRDPFILRDVRGQVIVVYPFQYNPVSKVLRIYTDLTVKLSPSTFQPGINELNRTKSPQTDPVYSFLYNSRFVNINHVQYTPTTDQGRMLVISYGPFMPAMQPFVDWKNRMGQPTEMVDVATIGNSPQDIKSYIENYYNTNGLTFVLLVGDGPEIPPYPSQYGDSDPGYGYILGNDSYAEVIVGRFSAENIADVETQVHRSLTYEMYPDPNGTWYHKGVCIGSGQGPGDDGEMDYEHERNIRTKIMNYTYTDADELYDGSQGGMDNTGDPTAADLNASLNDGRSFFTYTGHGSVNACSTTGFSSSDVPNLTNTSALPFIWSVACVNGDFASNTCFAEVLMRTTNTSGEPLGAIATLMSTINQSWDPPMDGQDEMVDIMVESYPNNIRHTFGGLSVNGCMHMNDEYGSAGYEMTDTWTCFGDPSLTVRTATPEPLQVSHDATIDVMVTNWLVHCNVNGALVCLSHNNQILGTGHALGGIAGIPVSGLTAGDTLDVTVTAYNHIPYFGSVVVVPNGTTGTGTYAGSISGLLVYPAPASGSVTVSLPAQPNVHQVLDILDRSGRLVRRTLTETHQVQGRNEITLDISGIAPGYYFLKCFSGESVNTGKLVIQ
ncbi:MAG: T9SS type A sorting domain-containing protein [Bacteroidia bacterium]|nr:T9SS type A sorting domain-containing protein [Bacteroidia bacterium]